MGKGLLKFRVKKKRSLFFIAMYAIMYINEGSYECNYSDKSKGKSL
mgnify:FL=1